MDPKYKIEAPNKECIKIKGYKSFRRKIKKMRKDVKKLNRVLEKTVELKKKIL